MNVDIKRVPAPLEQRVRALQTVKFALATLWIIVLAGIGFGIWTHHKKGHLSAAGIGVNVFLLLLALALTWLTAKGARSIEEARSGEVD